jgi:hypothetical protein
VLVPVDCVVEAPCDDCCVADAPLDTLWSPPRLRLGLTLAPALISVLAFTPTLGLTFTSGTVLLDVPDLVVDVPDVPEVVPDVLGDGIVVVVDELLGEVAVPEVVDEVLGEVVVPVVDEVLGEVVVPVVDEVPDDVPDDAGAPLRLPSLCV